jgi:hypothetical protein
MLFVRIACAVYCVLLSVLLLAPDPFALVGLSRPPGPPGGRGVHLAFFTVLAFLVHASRWPARRAWLGVLLVGYALSTETLQLWIPNRATESLDFLENLLGLAAGTAIWWWLQKRERAAP